MHMCVMPDGVRVWGIEGTARQLNAIFCWAQHRHDPKQSLQQIVRLVPAVGKHNIEQEA